MLLKTFSTLFLFFFFTSCSTPEAQLRVRNTSTYIYDSVLVNTSGGTNTYATINPGTVSDYKTYDFAYSYAYISLYVDAVHYQLIPIDYVGEQKLTGGSYTYEVSVYDTVSHQLMLNLVED